MKIEFPVLIIGLGKSGNSALRLLKGLYPNSEIKTYDAKDPSADFSQTSAALSYNPKTLVVSPGVPLSSSWIQNLVSSGAQLESELSLAFNFLKQESVIAITGSMGKSTTTSLLGAAVHALSSANFVGGNLGFPLADYVYSVLFQNQPRADWVVLELSSYQLENFKNLISSASLLTALSHNHLERYPNLDTYYQTKWNLKDKTKGPFFLNYDNPEIVRWCSAKLDSKTKKINSLDFQDHPMKMVGLHNRENLSLALAVAQYFSWPPAALSAIENYPGLSHRLEFVNDSRGVRKINDSKATTIESVLAAVNSCLPDVKAGGRLHLLVGGRDKNLPWTSLNQLKNHQNLQCYFFGECGDLAKSQSELSGLSFTQLKLAAEAALAASQSGDVILLSPGGSSMDEFTNFEARGDFFKSLCCD
ncbi:MAG: UDP-N-acetylmuramoyl-L-alanine--D-glutamate ligase [Bdellovibrionales bacterium]